MLTSEAHIETERPSRYLTQLCKHFNNKGRHLSHGPRAHHGDDTRAPHGSPMLSGIRPDQIHVEMTDTYGMLRLPWGVCTMEATPGALTLHAQAADEENLQRLQDLVAAHLARFSRRDPLTVSWQRFEAPAVPADESAHTAPGPAAAPSGRHGRRTGIAAAGAVVAVVAVHLGLGGAVLADMRWTGWAVGLVVTAVLVKVCVVGTLALRRSRRRTG